MNTLATPKSQYVYLSDAEYAVHMDKIADYNFATRVDEAGRNACIQLAKGFTFIIPYLDRYVLDMKRCLISETDLKRHYEGWDKLPHQHRNKILKMAEKHNAKALKGILQLQEFANHQSSCIDKLDEESQDLLLSTEATEVDTAVATEIRTYLKPGMEVMMTSTQVCEYLITISKGMCIYWPTTISKAMEKRGFEQVNGKWFVDIVQG